jgi:hypothetical protein
VAQKPSQFIFLKIWILKLFRTAKNGRHKSACIGQKHKYFYIYGIKKKLLTPNTYLYGHSTEKRLHKLPKGEKHFINFPEQI